MTSTTNDLIPLAGIACETNTGIQTLPLAAEPSFSYWQQDIPRAYWELDASALVSRVAAAREKLGTRLIVLGHHYQREDIIQFADLRGDSFKLAQWAAGHPEADYILFCGVHFMAEAADILSAPHQTVVLPNMAAGCSMADMADPEDVYACWEELEEAGVADKVVPVTYMNSAASLKAFCGRHGGIVCTSSNAPAVLRWAFERGEKVLFFPDQHLGRNTGARQGIPLDQMLLWDYNQPATARSAARLWKSWSAPVSSSGRATAPSTSALPSIRSKPPARSSPISTSSSTRSAAMTSSRRPTLTAQRSSSLKRSPRRRPAASSPSARRSISSAASRTKTRTSSSSASTPSSVPARRCTVSTRPTSPGRLRS